jgi:hypothetical protein
VEACWYADLQPCRYAADLQHSGDPQEAEHGPGRQEAVAQVPGVAAAAAVIQPDCKDQREAEGPDGVVEVAAVHLHREVVVVGHESKG